MNVELQRPPIIAPVDSEVVASLGALDSGPAGYAEYQTPTPAGCQPSTTLDMAPHYSSDTLGENGRGSLKVDGYAADCLVRRFGETTITNIRWDPFEGLGRDSKSFPSALAKIDPSLYKRLDEFKADNPDRGIESHGDFGMAVVQAADSASSFAVLETAQRNSDGTLGYAPDGSESGILLLARGGDQTTAVEIRPENLREWADPAYGRIRPDALACMQIKAVGTNQVLVQADFSGPYAGYHDTRIFSIFIEGASIKIKEIKQVGPMKTGNLLGLDHKFTVMEKGIFTKADRSVAGHGIVIFHKNGEVYEIPNDTDYGHITAYQAAGDYFVVARSRPSSSDKALTTVEVVDSKGRVVSQIPDWLESSHVGGTQFPYMSVYIESTDYNGSSLIVVRVINNSLEEPFELDPGKMFIGLVNESGQLTRGTSAVGVPLGRLYSAGDLFARTDGTEVSLTFKYYDDPRTGEGKQSIPASLRPLPKRAVIQNRFAGQSVATSGPLIRLTNAPNRPVNNDHWNRGGYNPDFDLSSRGVRNPHHSYFPPGQVR